MLTIKEILRICGSCYVQLSDGQWYPARPLTGSFRFERLRDAWEVLMGRADAVVWPENKER